MDKIDEQILVILAANSRTSFRDVAKRVGLSPPSTIERIAKMQDAGIIRGFTITVDRVAMGRPVEAFVRTSTDAGRGPELLAAITASPEVEECHKVTGNDSYVLKVSAPSVAALDAMIDRIAKVGVVNTSLILSTPLQPRLPLASIRPSQT